MSVYYLTHCCLYPFVYIFRRKKEICPWEYIERMVVSIIVASMKDKNYKSPTGRNEGRSFNSEAGLKWHLVWFHRFFIFTNLSFYKFQQEIETERQKTTSKWIRTNIRTNSLYRGRQPSKLISVETLLRLYFNDPHRNIN